MGSATIAHCMDGHARHCRGGAEEMENCLLCLCRANVREQEWMGECGNVEEAVTFPAHATAMELSMRSVNHGSRSFA